MDTKSEHRRKKLQEKGWRKAQQEARDRLKASQRKGNGPRLKIQDLTSNRIQSEGFVGCDRC